MTAPLAILAAGGTGGHMFPAQALAEALIAKGWRVILSTDERGARYAGAFPAQVERAVVASATFARGGALARVLVPLKVLGGVLAARRAMRRDRPRVVVGFGGYPSIPALAAAWSLGLPRLIHEQNGVLGRVNRIFARRVSLVACGIWPTAVPPGARAEAIGNPVRQAVRDRAAAPYIPPGDHPMQVLVIGGSQGARILSDVVPAAVAALPPDLRGRLRLSHQAREEDGERVRAVYDAAGIRAEVMPFFTDLPARMAAAELVISRAGASSVADISVIGRPAILIPYAAAAADHQTANARMLTEVGAAIALAEPEATVARMASEIAAILGDPARATAMASAAVAASRPDATERLLALVEGLAGMTEGPKP